MDKTTEQVRNVEEFSAFYERTIDIVYGYFVRRTAGDRHLAEDLTQETFLAAARTFDDTLLRSETAWVVAIARRRLVDHIRRTKARPHVTTPTVPETAAWPEEWGADEREVFTALNRLGADQQTALVLHYVDGLTVGEAAQLMGRPRTAVYSLLARARRALKEQLKEIDHA